MTVLTQIIVLCNQSVLHSLGNLHNTLYHSSNSVSKQQILDTYEIRHVCKKRTQYLLNTPYLPNKNFSGILLIKNVKNKLLFESEK